LRGFLAGTESKEDNYFAYPEFWRLRIVIGLSSNYGIAMKTLRYYAVVLLVALTLSAASVPKFEWPDSDHYSRVIVNATQGIESRPRVWFAQDKLVTDLAITNVDQIGNAAAVKEYDAIRHTLESWGLAVGTYTSGTTVITQTRETHWPWQTVPSEWMSISTHYIGDWPTMPYRKILDLSDRETMNSFHEGLKRLWERTPAPVRFVDNAGIHSSAGKGQKWNDYCTNMLEIRRIGESMGSLQVFNIAMHVGMLSDDEMKNLISAVGGNGIAIEMPWSPAIRKDKTLTRNAEARYRQLLDAGEAIILIPLDVDAQPLAAWVRTWRKPTDHLYLAGSFFKPPDLNVFGSVQTR
jgi:hypothetical protein